MRVSRDANHRDIDIAFQWASSVIGGSVHRSITNFEMQEQRNPLLTSHFRENFALEFAFANAQRYRETNNRLPYEQKYYPLYGFLVPAHRISAALESAARSAFEGRLKMAASDTHGLRPFEFEVSLATHVMTKKLGRYIC
jgi:hypothetical protein